MGLTVIIPAKNEAAHIGSCIDSVLQLADEVILADSGSDDETIPIAESLGCRIIEREYVHSGDFKNWAIPHASNDWVLIVDADERCHPPLLDEIDKRLSTQEPDVNGYWIRRKNFFMGRHVKFSGWQNDRCLRLFRRDLGRYVGQTDHAEIQLKVGRADTLEHRLVHFTYHSYDQYLAKLNRYATRQAEVWFQQGRRPNYLRMLGTLPFRFVQTYFFRRGFLDGYPGLQLCAMTAYYSFLKQAKLWERWNVVPMQARR